MAKRSLKQLLDDAGADDMDVVVPEAPAEPGVGLCSDCGDHPAEVFCATCDEPFCEVCFGYIHRTGKRREHTHSKLDAEDATGARTDAREGAGDASAGEHVPADASLSDESSDSSSSEDEVDRAAVLFEPDTSAARDALRVLKENAEYIPMRLTHEERALLRLLNAALDVSEYVDRVDCFALVNKTKRIVAGLREICTVLTGLVVANDLEAGRTLLDGREFAEHAAWFQQVFEIGRRYKIMNPERMRSTYGKLVYMVMDSRLPEIRDLLEFDLYKPVLTVGAHLRAHGAAALLDDVRLVAATAEVAGGRPRAQIQRDIRRKERAIEALVQRHGEPARQAIYSLGDFHAYIEANRAPVLAMLQRLRADFAAADPEPQLNLSISSGVRSARLTHNHRRQFQYVLQSLTLWAEIMGSMYLLWSFADADLLDERRYMLGDTGQGLNRMKASPKVGREMHRLIARAQQQTGSWVGSAVVHLGDTAVPNALFFLDKYLQVPRILNPVNAALTLLPRVLASDAHASRWVDDEFGSVEKLQQLILVDFFRHAFDGSGADNFYDAGSCIDGRLTSAWNWANSLSKKSYYKHFLITGFVGFDGSEGF